MPDDGWDETAVRRHDRPLRALIADDDEGIRRLLATVLELDGWDVRCAADGDDAVAMAEAYHPDALLLDVMMPNSDGLSALRRIRANDAHDDMAVVMVSALGEGHTRVAAEAAGADDYIVKPVVIEEVSERVLRLVRSTELPSAGSQPWGVSRRTTLAGTPATTLWSATMPRTTELAPTTTLRPSWAPGRMTAPAPSQEPEPMRTGSSLGHWRVTGTSGSP